MTKRRLKGTGVIYDKVQVDGHKRGRKAAQKKLDKISKDFPVTQVKNLPYLRQALIRIFQFLRIRRRIGQRNLREDQSTGQVNLQVLLHFIPMKGL